jgi:hypothetical protein
MIAGNDDQWTFSTCLPMSVSALVKRCCVAASMFMRPSLVRNPIAVHGPEPVLRRHLARA